MSHATGAWSGYAGSRTVRRFGYIRSHRRPGRSVHEYDAAFSRPGCEAVLVLPYACRRTRLWAHNRAFPWTDDALVPLERAWPDDLEPVLCIMASGNAPLTY